LECAWFTNLCFFSEGVFSNFETSLSVGGA
jgi:hypothetical protein